MKRTSTLKRTGWKRKAKTARKLDPDKAIKTKLPSEKSARTKADSLLTPLIKFMFPLCLLCNNPTEVAHHHVHKSKSTRLRYELDNLIPLCRKCHCKLHHDESYWASVVVETKGMEWFKELSRKKQESVKADVHYFIENRNRLQGLLDELKKME